MENFNQFVDPKQYTSKELEVMITELSQRISSSSGIVSSQITNQLINLLNTYQDELYDRQEMKKLDKFKKEKVIFDQESYLSINQGDDDESKQEPTYRPEW